MTATASAYLLLLPPGWVTIPGAVSPDRAIQGIMTQVPWVVSDESDWATQLGTALAKAKSAADGTGVLLLDSYLPVGAIPGTQVACSIAAALIPVDNPDHRDLDQLLLDQLARRGATAAEVDGVPAIRWADAASQLGIHDGIRSLARVHYLARVPGLDDRFFSMTLSVATPLVAPDPEVVAAEAPLIHSLGELFDAIVTTVRWTDAAGVTLSIGRHTPGAATDEKVQS